MRDILETELFLEDVVQQVAVLACLRVVQEVVGAHEGCNTSLDGIGERPEKANQYGFGHAWKGTTLPSIKLMQCLVVNV
jgi:hypothetical protein